MGKVQIRIEKAPNGGAAVYETWFDGPEEMTGCYATFEEATASLSLSSSGIKKRPTPHEAAADIRACMPDGCKQDKKIQLIKAIRNASGCGLVEAKEAAERSIALGPIHTMITRPLEFKSMTWDNDETGTDPDSDTDSKGMPW